MNDLRIGIFIYNNEERKIEDYVNIVMLVSYFLADKSKLKTGLVLPTEKQPHQLQFLKKTDLLSIISSAEEELNKENQIIIEIKNYKSDFKEIVDYDFGLILIEQNFYDVKEFAYKMVDIMNNVKESPLTSTKDFHILFIGDSNFHEKHINSIDFDITNTKIDEIFQILTISGSKALLQIINGEEEDNNDSIVNLIRMIYKGFLESFYAKVLDIFNYKIISLKNGYMPQKYNIIKYDEEEFKEILKSLDENNYYQINNQ